MSYPITFNGSSYTIPAPGDTTWGANVSAFLVAIPSGTLQPNATTFTLTGGDLDFGANYGLKSLYYKSRTANPATAGQIRLAKTDLIEFRNNANGGNLVLGIDSSDNLIYQSNVFAYMDINNSGSFSLGSTPDSKAILTLTSTTKGFLPPRLTTTQRDNISSPTTGLLVHNSTTNMLNHYNGSVWAPLSENTGVNAGTTGQLAYYASSGSIVSGLTLTASRALVSDSSGLLAVATTTSTEIGYVNGVTSAIQTQLDNKLSLSGGTLSGALTITPTTNQLILGTGTTLTLNAPSPGVSRVVTFPDPTANDSVVYLALAQTLTNKILPKASTYLDGTIHDEFELNSDGNGVLLSCSGISADRTFTFPNESSQQLVGNSATQTLTNKTLSKASTAVDGTTTDTFEVNSDGNGLTLDTTGLSADRTITFPNEASQVMTGTTATQTLTNKTLTAPVIATIVNTGTLTLPTATTTLIGTDTTDSLTNKTLTSTTNHVAAESLHSASTVVNVSSATAPSAGQVLKATSSTAATWQTLVGLTAYAQSSAGATTIGNNSSAISAPVVVMGRVDLPALDTTTVTINKGSSTAASNIYAVWIQVVGNFSNLAYLNNVSTNTLPKSGSTIAINNVNNEALSVYILAIVD